MGNTIIEINGKRYNAQTGDLIGDGKLQPARPVRAAHRGRVVDGFITPAAKQHRVAQSIASPVAPKPVAKKPLPQKKRALGVHASAPKPQKAQTLMRHSVLKPAAPQKPAAKAQGAAEMVAHKPLVPAPSLKLAAHNVNHPRLARAKRQAQSQHITRFTQAQANHPAKGSAPQIAAGATAQRRTNYVQAPAHRTRTTQRPHANPGAHGAVAHPKQPAQTAQKKPHVDIFEAAIANARSHEQPQHKAKAKPHRRIINVVSGVFALFLLGGFLAFANMTNIEMRVASMRAGFSAQLPGYAPVGYALDGGIKSESGVVATTFRSGESAYTLKQQVSDWDSTTLLDNIVTASGRDYKAIESQGRTIYIYGNDAAWVDGGVLYNIKGDGSISPKEISSIAASI